ncbi:MAG: hypothetical protein AAGA84_11505 [Pseudomonadota bacterium]
MLVRDAIDASGVEVFMLKRHSGTDFANAYVFPGGLVAEQDNPGDLDPYCDGLDDAEASRQLGLSAGGLAYWLAALRECFEESGFLLARLGSGRLWQSADLPSDQDATMLRNKLNSREMTMPQFCELAGVTLCCELAQYVAFWTTPEMVRRRYATRFFVAQVPEGQTGAADGRETVASQWVNVRGVLEDPERIRSMQLHPPTLVNLQWLGQFDDAAAVMAAAETMDKQAIGEIVPEVIGDGLGRRVRLNDGQIVSF